MNKNIDIDFLREGKALMCCLLAVYVWFDVVEI